jgi:hypothetical protein
VLQWAGRFMRVVGCRPRLALHREEIACVIPDALPTSNYNFDTHRSMEQSRVNCREQWRWWSETLCGAKALHVLEHLRHPLLICQASRPLRLHLLTFPPLFFSWVCNITSQCCSNSKRRYITQVLMSYKSTNLELLYAML